MPYLQLYSFKSDKGLKKTPVIRRCHSINSGSLNITSTISLNNLVLQAFGPDSTQEEVYNETTKHLVQNVIEGYNATVFAYGATGTVLKHQGRRIYGGGGGISLLNFQGVWLVPPRNNTLSHNITRIASLREKNINK